MLFADMSFLAGRLYFSLSDGRKDDTSPYEELYTFGGRGFSIWDAADLSLVYDSGADFEEYHAKYMPSMFNNHVGSRAHTPEEDFDARSDDNVSVGVTGCTELGYPNS